THISMRPVVRHGTVPAQRSGHGRHQAAYPQVPAPVEPRTSSDGRPRPEVSVPSPSSVNIQETLNQHIDSTQAWQRHTGERIHDMEQLQLQRQEEWRAYCRWTGFNPDQP